MAGQKNFEVDQNATFSFIVEYKDNNGLPIDLTGATATTYSWSRVSGTIPSSFTGASLQTATLNATGSGSVTVQCIINYSGGSVTPQVTLTFPRPI